MPWPRIQFHELGDQTWCPSWLHHHEQFSLSQLWNLRVPFWSRGSLATQATAVITQHLHNLSSYTIIDICAGAGGPTPFIESELNRKTAEKGNDPVKFVLTDMFPPLDVWRGITKKQPHIEFIERSVDARSVGRLILPGDGRRECRLFNICFHHFDDGDAAGILADAVDSADAFIIFEITARQISTLLCTPLVFFWGFYVTALWYWSSPIHLFSTYVIPIAPLALWIDGFISCLRTRTPGEIDGLIKKSGVDTTGWKFSSGERSVQWPFITLYYYAGMKIIIIGAGLGGLSCAISCLRSNLSVVILERASETREIGAGIQIPPNGTRILEHYGLLDEVMEKGSQVQQVDFRRYDSGKVLRSMPMGEGVVEEFGSPWLIIHREDFYRVLHAEAVRLGAEIRLNSEVTDVIFETTEVVLAGGERVAGDVIVGADGIYSLTRDIVLGTSTPPVETGDLAYRAIFQKHQLEALNDAKVDELCSKTAVTSWLGPDKHTIFYPVRGGGEFNLVLMRPDNLDSNIRRTFGDVEEMRESFAGWDETGPVALLGDACHPTLPYQAQGAAMAVEDGFAIGKLLDLLDTYFPENNFDSEASSSHHTFSHHIPAILTLYENIRKARTTRNVQAAIRNRRVFHTADGFLQIIRDFILGYMGVTRKSDWTTLLSARMRGMFCHDLAGECERAFEEFKRMNLQ
ncbi:hypothetical protein BJY04DRAFT_211989 [Aspergillus karnatakaensis]|uniref:uncharacterized protein n=1 Tax=Aspergillus karnatakaensis TaxID=1810916 RepID=UPI003CCD745B